MTATTATGTPLDALGRDLTILPAAPHAGVTEVLWHERRVEAFGTLRRVTVPVIGADRGNVPIDALTRELQGRWVGRPALSPTANVTSVVVELQDDDLSGRRLVLLVTADALPRDHSVVNVRMVRDLRRALRDVRRFGVSAGPSPSAAPLATAA